MKRFVVDASVAMKWFVPEAHQDAALRLLDDSCELLAPDFMAAEFGNILWKKMTYNLLRCEGLEVGDLAEERSHGHWSLADLPIDD
ncbi:MAG: type II toxin-antitoxin system VapC family toxin [Acidobacteria bacterium]|nr:type II toxin-antitoxin system VapC family toxin [Acidobacteriota bacterium]